MFILDYIPKLPIKVFFSKGKLLLDAEKHFKYIDWTLYSPQRYFTEASQSIAKQFTAEKTKVGKFTADQAHRKATHS
jgi:hypothetical protein